MFKPARLLPALLFFSALLLAPAAAEAEPLVIQSGFVQIGGVFPPGRGTFRSISYNFSGGGLAASGGTVDGSTQQVLGGCTFGPCAAGALSNGGSNASLQGMGSSSILGVYSGFSQHNGSLFAFTTDALVIPGAGASIITIQTPFQMSGTLFAQGLVNGSLAPVFNTEVTGQGLATLTFSLFTQNGVTGYALHTIRYDFAPVAQTPEPATLLLLGAGLAGLAARSSRRRARRDS